MVEVPTKLEFDALVARVTQLEQDVDATMTTWNLIKSLIAQVNSQVNP